MNISENTSSRGSLVYGADELDKAVDVVYPLFEHHKIITLTGSLGAGKTTLVQALLRKMGVTGAIQSPTFSYVHTYNLSTGSKLYHFDLYRLPSLEAFLGAGFDEYLHEKNAKVLIEWPAIIAPLLTQNICAIELDYEGLEARQLTYACR